MILIKIVDLALYIYIYIKKTLHWNINSPLYSLKYQTLKKSTLNYTSYTKRHKMVICLEVIKPDHKIIPMIHHILGYRNWIISKMCCYLVLKTQHTVARYKSTVTDKKPETTNTNYSKMSTENNGGHKKNTFVQIKMRPKLHFLTECIKYEDFINANQ